jgi:hypothetical protein
MTCFADCSRMWLLVFSCRCVRRLLLPSVCVFLCCVHKQKVSCVTWEGLKAASTVHSLSIPQYGKLQLCATTGQEGIDEMNESTPLWSRITNDSVLERSALYCFSKPQSSAIVCNHCVCVCVCVYWFRKSLDTCAEVCNSASRLSNCDGN